MFTIAHTPRHAHAAGAPCDRAVTSHDCPRGHTYAPTRSGTPEPAADAMRDAWNDYVRHLGTVVRYGPERLALMRDARSRERTWATRAARDRLTDLRIGGAI